LFQLNVGGGGGFANGGVVNRATSFMMTSGRMGVMGEAGPEAILPLKRGANGQLGIQAGGGSGVVINQSFNFVANGDESVKKIIAEEAPRIAKYTEQQIITLSNKSLTLGNEVDRCEGHLTNGDHLPTFPSY
jgi:phage-related minor tail protein